MSSDGNRMEGERRVVINKTVGVDCVTSTTFRFFFFWEESIPLQNGRLSMHYFCDDFVHWCTWLCLTEVSWLCLTVAGHAIVEVFLCDTHSSKDASLDLQGFRHECSLLPNALLHRRSHVFIAVALLQFEMSIGACCDVSVEGPLSGRRQRCESWRWRTYAWVRVGPLSCERARFFFSPRQEAFFVLSHEETPVFAPCPNVYWSLLVFPLVPVVSLVPCQSAVTHRHARREHRRIVPHLISSHLFWSGAIGSGRRCPAPATTFCVHLSFDRLRGFQEITNLTLGFGRPQQLFVNTSKIPRDYKGLPLMEE